MNGVYPDLEPDDSDFVEVDPTGRYGRYNEILGKGSSKTVYRAFDEYEGIEVAWNQVELYYFLQSPEDLERLYCEIHLLKTLKHKNIMKFYTSWVDSANRNINFVTEMFTSGTLRQYRQRHKKVNIRVVKHWCRQILNGLLYLHNHDPPVIHRDLKCDNIFVNGNTGEVKIGDLGLAAILRKSHAAHCVGTPEFMAPEVYEEEYNELVDIYSFGMCILEMVTFEYPYSECTHPAEIYKKVISGKKPEALHKVKDPEVRQFVEKCLATVPLRLSASELLQDPFLQIDDFESDLSPKDTPREFSATTPLLRQPSMKHSDGCSVNNDHYSNVIGIETQNGFGYHLAEVEPCGIELFEYYGDDYSQNVDVSIKGKRREDDSIFLRLRIADQEDRVRNIYFPFDIEMDTALSVATEMVGELDITDQDVTKIADMIDGEISSLVPEWKPGPGIEETPRFANSKLCQNCASDRTSNSSLENLVPRNPPCSAMHGRFEEIMYQVDGPDQQPENIDDMHRNEIWDQHAGCEFSSVGSRQSHFNPEHLHLDQETFEETSAGTENKFASHCLNCFTPLHDSNSFTELRLFSDEPSDDHENETQQETRWMKAENQMKTRELMDLQLEHVGNPSGLCSTQSEAGNNRNLLRSCASDSEFGSSLYRDRQNSYLRNHKSTREAPNARELLVFNGFYNSALMSHSLHRTTSLPVDAVEI